MVELLVLGILGMVCYEELQIYQKSLDNYSLVRGILGMVWYEELQIYHKSLDNYSLVRR